MARRNTHFRDRLLRLGCSTISHLAQFPAVHESRLGMDVTRVVYNMMCAAFIKSRDDVAEIENISIPGPAGSIDLRIYRPVLKRNLPGVVFLHGGCFSVGDLNSHDAMLRALANASACTFISVDYRLSPENPFPAGAEDAYAALQWVDENAESLRINKDKLVIAGDSAGGAIAATVARWARDKGGPKLALQVLIYPMTDARQDTESWQQFKHGPVINKALLAAAWEHYCPDAEKRLTGEISPMSADLHGLPPAIVLTAEKDPLRDEGEIYARELSRKGVPVLHKRYDGATHGFVQNPDTELGRGAIHELADGMSHQLGGINIHLTGTRSHYRYLAQGRR